MRPDFGIDARGDIRSQILLALSKCRRRVGFTRYLASNVTVRGKLLTDPCVPTPTTHRFQLNLQLLKPLLGHVPELRLPAIRPTLQSTTEPLTQTTPNKKRRIVVHAAPRWQYRQWPVDRWAEVLRPLLDETDLDVVLVCAPGETGTMRPLLDLLDERLECRETSLPALRTLISEASLFVGLDSGPANLASLLGTKAVVLFGPGDADLWGPLGIGSIAIHRTADYSCHPCLQKECIHPENPCMNMISSAEVLAAIRDRIGLPQSFPSSLLPLGSDPVPAALAVRQHFELTHEDPT